MTYKQVLDECRYYVRKIAVLENWFRYLYIAKHIKRGTALHATLRPYLRKIRPPAIPTILGLKCTTKKQMLIDAEPLSLYAARLDDKRWELFNDNIPEAKWPRFIIVIYMHDLERGIYPNWQCPFTREIKSRFKLFDTEKPGEPDVTELLENRILES